MIQLVLILGATLTICFVMSTKEQRAAARERMKRFNRPLLIVLLIAWAFILFPWGDGR